jgi:hypothetical protein
VRSPRGDRFPTLFSHHPFDFKELLFAQDSTKSMNMGIGTDS